jgi:parallel beta-helix repeat protein
MYYNKGGIDLLASVNNTIKDNVLTFNEDGIAVMVSNGSNIFRNNQLIDSGFRVWGYDLFDFIQDIDTSNTIDGKPIYYLINRNNLIIDSATTPNPGYLGIVNSTNLIIRDLNLSNHSYYSEGLLLAFTNDSLIENMKILNNHRGIYIVNSTRNTFRGNTISFNWIGLYFILSDDNKFYHNNFINNTDHVDYIDSLWLSINEWNDGEDGNYWSDYDTEKEGCFDSDYDGICDSPYVIDAINQDNSPFTQKDGWVCTCTPWMSTGECCVSLGRLRGWQTRTCNPSGCDMEERCYGYCRMVD